MPPAPLAVVTGATQGIGRAVADRFIAAGYALAVCARGAAELARLRQGYADAYPGRPVIAERCDVGVADQVRAFAKTVLQQHPVVDVLVNNAGTFEPGALIDGPDDQLGRLLAVNLLGAHHLTRALLPALRRAGAGGHIFNVCSVAGLQPYPAGGAYAVSKYAMRGFNDTLRDELKEQGIRVTGVYPGATWSASWTGVELPRERLMEPTDVAVAIIGATLLSPQAVVEQIVLRPQRGDL